MKSRLSVGLCFGLTCLGLSCFSTAQAGQYLGQLTWPEAETAFAEMPIVVIPFGAGAKEHGPHLPMNSDEMMMRYLTDAAVTEADVLVVPPLLHGWFPAFRQFPGTEVANVEVFQNYLHEIARSMVRQGAQRIVFLNTGIEKATGLPIAIVAREILAEYAVPTLVVNWDDLETEEAGVLAEQQRGGHADEIETSIQLYLQGQMVHQERAVVDYREAVVKASVGYQPGMFSRAPDSPHYSSSGVFGDARLASAEKGEKVLAVMRKNWLKALSEFAVVPAKRQQEPETAPMK